MRMTKMSYTAVMAISMMVGSTSAVQANSFEEILSNGKYSLQIRPRYEFVDEDNANDNANAFTVRTVLGAKFDA